MYFILKIRLPSLFLDNSTLNCAFEVIFLQTYGGPAGFGSAKNVITLVFVKTWMMSCDNINRAELHSWSKTIIHIQDRKKARVMSNMDPQHKSLLLLCYLKRAGICNRSWLWVKQYYRGTKATLQLSVNFSLTPLFVHLASWWFRVTLYLWLSNIPMTKYCLIS